MSLAFQHHSYLFNFGVRKDFILGMLKSPKFYNKKAYWFHSANFQPLTSWNMSGRKTVHNLRLQLSRSSQCRCISSLILIINSVVAAKNHILRWDKAKGYSCAIFPASSHAGDDCENAGADADANARWRRGKQCSSRTQCIKLLVRCSNSHLN